ncbi:MAG: hypothetical protein NTZ52_04575 [Chlamydiae bacterium]|jgi:outer membrane protein assembly factor BamD (BamD/ComL family)|nr:hypothetical protein [Chlamydiota bacterium]
MRFTPFFAVIAAFVFFTLPSQAAYTIKDGKLIATNEVATLSIQEHYSLVLIAMQDKNWQELTVQSNIILKNFPDSPFAEEAQYYLGVGLFHLGELDVANKMFGKYLKIQSSSKFFEEALRYKFFIAERYQKGDRKHLFGIESLPRWMPAKEDAIVIFEEVAAALPHHELGIQSLYGKALLLLEDQEFQSSIESFQMIIRKFGKHPLACESYIGVGKAYLEQCQKEYADPDFLDLAEINLSKFGAEFSKEPRLAIAENMLAAMHEIYAENLYQTAQYYERAKKPHASAIYYNKIISKYPYTLIANHSDGRLNYLEKKYSKPYRDLRNLPSLSEDIVKADDLIQHPILSSESDSE